MEAPEPFDREEEEGIAALKTRVCAELERTGYSDVADRIRSGQETASDMLQVWRLRLPAATS